MDALRECHWRRKVLKEDGRTRSKTESHTKKCHLVFSCARFILNPSMHRHLEINGSAQIYVTFL